MYYINTYYMSIDFTCGPNVGELIIVVNADWSQPPFWEDKTSGSWLATFTKVRPQNYVNFFNTDCYRNKHSIHFHPNSNPTIFPFLFIWMKESTQLVQTNINYSAWSILVIRNNSRIILSSSPNTTILQNYFIFVNY